MSNEKNKTLLVTMDFPPQVGGVAQYYHNRVSKSPDDFVVLASELKSEQDEIGGDYEIIRKNFFVKYMWPHWLPLIGQVKRVVKEKNIDKVWVGQVIPVGTAVYLALKRKKIKYFVTCHGNDLIRAKKVGRKFQLAKKVLVSAEYIEAANNLARDILVKDYEISEDKIRVVWPEKNISRESVSPEKVEEIQKILDLEEKKVLLTVSRLVESKRVDRVIGEFAKVIEKSDDWRYVIVGDGPEFEPLRKQIESLGLENKVHLVGRVAPQEVANYYAMADTFILTPGENSDGDTESFGIVFLEAKEFDLPIIASDFGGIREAVGDYEKVEWFDEYQRGLEEVLKKII